MLVIWLTFASRNTATQLDFNAGEAFKNQLIPHAVLWFTGDAVERVWMDGDIWSSLRLGLVA